MRQRQWTKIASPRGTITHPNNNMISADRDASSSLARVNIPVANASNNNQTSDLMIDRLQEFSFIVRRSFNAAVRRQEAIDSSETTPIQPPPSPTNQITNEQRLRIAQTEWNKLLSRQEADQSSEQHGSSTAVLSAANRRDNIPWGDLLDKKGDNVTRVYSLSTNGLSIDRRGGRFDDLCKVVKEVNADIVCCQEHNLDTTRSNVRSVLYHTT